MESPPAGLEASQQVVDSSGEVKEAIVSEANPKIDWEEPLSAIDSKRQGLDGMCWDQSRYT